VNTRAVFSGIGPLSSPAREALSWSLWREKKGFLERESPYVGEDAFLFGRVLS